MDILEILKKSGKNLYPEDLDFFETELSTGGQYDDAYCIECRRLIKQLRDWMKGGDGKEEAAANTTGKTSRGLTVNIGDLVTGNKTDFTAGMTQEEILFHDVRRMREERSYKTQFKKYIASADFVDEGFIEKHYSFFMDWELDAIVSVKQLNEAFLEKYFGALDHNKIARYQQFSEAFFMKHFAQLDAEIVLIYGKNDWRKKENRSKQLDVFLRLKGVKI